MNVMVVAQHAQGTVAQVTREMVTAARTLGDVTLAVIAREPMQLTGQLDLDGVCEIVAVEVETDAFEPDIYVEAVSALVQARRPAVMLAPFTADGIGYAPAVAARLSLGFAADVHGLALSGNQVLATRSFYGGRVHAELEFPGAPSVVLLLRSGVWAAAPYGRGAAVTAFEAPAGRSRVRHIELVEPDAATDVDLTKAPFLLAIGGAVGDADGVAQFAKLSEQLGATLATSRPLVDLGLMPRARLVGQSGKIVKPKVYLAFGISGAVQHLAGIRDADTVIAVNVDPQAPIFQVADYGAVADVFDIADELARLW
jgi:electron transfer flavoprotein alpha subunit